MAYESLKRLNKMIIMTENVIQLNVQQNKVKQKWHAAYYFS